MYGVSCIPGRCVAVGVAPGSKRPKAWTLSRMRWHDDTLPAWTHPVRSLQSVSCPQVNMCISVGVIGVYGNGSDEGFAEQLAAGVWHKKGLPAGTPGLYSISCVSTTWCMAVGSEVVDENNGTTKTVALKWNGTTWNKVTAPINSLTDPNPWIDAVSCLSIDFCMEVGYSDQGTPLAEAWNGTAWTVTTPPPAGVFMTYRELDAVSCTSASSCLAVGAEYGCCGAYDGLAMAWDGSSWTNVSDQSSQFSLSGVSCTSATSCLVVGTQGPSDTQPLIPSAVVEKFDGTTWTGINVDAVGQQSALNAVTCLRANWCAAVGSFTTGTGVTHPLVERWNGRSLIRMRAA